MNGSSTVSTPAPTPTTMSWSDGIGSRGRGSWLLLIKGDNVTRFVSQGIPGLVVVRGTSFEKNGKWSKTTFRLELFPGVRAISGLDGWETGKFVEGLASAVRSAKPIDTWLNVAEALGVSVPTAMAFLREWRPKAADALDLVDEQLNALDVVAEAAEATTDNETLVVSFGGPTRAQRADGFWASPKGIQGHADAELRLIDLNGSWTKENITVVGIVGTVLSATHASGHGGGYVSVTVTLVPGTVVEKPAIPAAPISEEEAAERLVLKDLLEHEYVQGDIRRARRIDAFVRDVLAADSHAASFLADETETGYGRGGRTAAISNRLPTVEDHRNLDWAHGRDIVPVAFWAEKLHGKISLSAPKPVPVPVVDAKPADATSVQDAMAALMAKFGQR